MILVLSLPTALSAVTDTRHTDSLQLGHGGSSGGVVFGFDFLSLPGGLGALSSHGTSINQATY